MHKRDWSVSFRAQGLQASRLNSKTINGDEEGWFNGAQVDAATVLCAVVYGRAARA